MVIPNCQIARHERPVAVRNGRPLGLHCPKESPAAEERFKEAAMICRNDFEEPGGPSTSRLRPPFRWTGGKGWLIDRLGPRVALRHKKHGLYHDGRWSEYRWTTELSAGARANSDCTPRVLAAGTELGGYDLAWFVVEKLAGSPLSAKLDQTAVEDLLRTAACWYMCAERARSFDDAPPVNRENWTKLVGRARDAVKTAGVAESQRWNEALRQVQRGLASLVERWESRPINTWCHGDLHPGNAMRRDGHAPGTGCVLIDLALVHPGHWIEDAVYLERWFWGKPELLFGIKPVSTIARHLREAGRSVNEDYAMLANVRRVLMAASVPAYLDHEGHPRYVHAALEMLEKLLPVVGKS